MRYFGVGFVPVTLGVSRGEMSQHAAQQGAAPDRRQSGRFCSVSALLLVGRDWAAAGELGRSASARSLVDAL